MSASGEENDSESRQTIQDTLKDLFGEEIAKKFKDEDIDKEAIEDLLKKDADAKIFLKLGLSYGKAIRFKREFSKLYPVPCKGARTNKPTMGKLESCTPEIKRLYLTKRKKVGMLAAAHWNTGKEPFQLPKFNSLEKKQELMNFAESIEDTCGVPEVGFGKDGIAEHIQTFFSEQRRYKKRQRSSGESQSSDSQDSTDSTTVPLSQVPGPILPTMPDAKRQKNNKKDNADNTISVEETDEELSTASTEILSDDENEGTSDVTNMAESNATYNKTSSSIIIKGVLGKLPDREGLCKMLINKFKVPPRNLTSLTHVDVFEVMARKLVNLKYVKISSGNTAGQLKKEDVTVLKEIDV